MKAALDVQSHHDDDPESSLLQLSPSPLWRFSGTHWFRRSSVERKSPGSRRWVCWYSPACLWAVGATVDSAGGDGGATTGHGRSPT